MVSEIFHPEDRGGQGRQAYELAEALLAHGCEVRVITRRQHAASSAHDRVGNLSVRRLPPAGLMKGRGWRAIGPTLVFLGALLWTLLVNARRYDVLFVHGVKLILIPPLLVRALLRKRVLVKVDATAELEQSITAESLAQMGMKANSPLLGLWSALRRRLLRQADGVIAISGELHGALLRAGVAPERIVDVPNGVDLSRWQPVTPARRQALRTRLGLPDVPLFICVGRLSRAKGLPSLMHAWLRLCAEGANAQLLVLGTGVGSHDDCTAELQALRAASPHGAQVTFTGQVENAHEYLQASDVFVLPSEHEGFGLALVEAMACALPCISTPVGAARDVIQSGSNGWLVPIGDTQALHGALRTLLEQRAQWQALGRAARTAVMSRYDLQQVAQRYVQLFATLQAQAPPARSLSKVAP